MAAWLGGGGGVGGFWAGGIGGLGEGFGEGLFAVCQIISIPLKTLKTAEMDQTHGVAVVKGHTATKMAARCRVTT